jgi:flagellar protein FliO/FliZ
VDNLLLALRVVVSLGVVIGAIWFLQRRMSRGGTKAKRTAIKPMSVVARQNLGPKASVAVVEFGGKRLLLGVTEHGIAVLDDSAAPELAVEPAPADTPAVAAVTRRAASKQNSRDFAQVLRTSTEPAQTARAAAEAPAARPAPVRLTQNDLFSKNFTQSPKLGGSILSAATWKQAWTAVRGGR